MNDNELTSMVRESVTDIRSATSVDQIISRGHKARARRRVPAAAGALAMAGAAALGVTALAPSGHPAPPAAGKAGSPPAVVRLDAWTVVRQANGKIGITIRQLKHPAKLQATLRADGLPVHVSLHQHDNVCESRGVTRDQALEIYRFFNKDGSYVITIDPSVLPSGVGLIIEDLPSRSSAYLALGIGTVHTSPQCTG